VTPRINFANDVSARFVGRDSAQAATRIVGTARTAFRTRASRTVSHCGGVSQWSVESGAGWDR